MYANPWYLSLPPPQSYLSCDRAFSSYFFSDPLLNGRVIVIEKKTFSGIQFVTKIPSFYMKYMIISARSVEDWSVKIFYQHCLTIQMRYFNGV